MGEKVAKSVGKILKELGNRFSNRIKVEEFYDGAASSDIHTEFQDLGSKIKLVLKVLELSFEEIVEENERLNRKRRRSRGSEILPGIHRVVNEEQDLFEDVQDNDGENREEHGVEESNNKKKVEERLSASGLTDLLNHPSQHIEEALSQEDDNDVELVKKSKKLKKRKKSSKNKILVPETIPVISTQNEKRINVSIPDTPDKRGTNRSCLHQTQDVCDGGLSQEIDSSSGEPETSKKKKQPAPDESPNDGVVCDSRDGSPIFFRSRKPGSDFPDRIKMVDRKGAKKKLESCGDSGQKKEPAGDAKPSGVKSSVAEASVGSITPTIQKNVNRQTWQELGSDFSGGRKVPAPEPVTPSQNEDDVKIDDQIDYEESPNLLKQNRGINRLETRSSRKAEDQEKENQKPKKSTTRQKKAPVENRWGLTVEPLTESQKKKAKNERQSTLDMFFNKGQGIKRTQSELERVLAISKETYEAENNSGATAKEDGSKKRRKSAEEEKTAKEKIEDRAVKKKMEDRVLTKEEKFQKMIDERIKKSREREEQEAIEQEAKRAAVQDPASSGTASNNNSRPAPGGRGRKPRFDYKPPPETPPNFWDPDIVELEPDDPRGITQQAPPFRTRAVRKKEYLEKRRKEAELQKQKQLGEKQLNGSCGKRKLLHDSDEDSRSNAEFCRNPGKRKSFKNCAAEDDCHVSPSDDDFEF